MPLIVHIEADVVLDETWLTKAEWECWYKDDLRSFAEELLGEDPLAFLEQTGGVMHIVSVRWEDEGHHPHQDNAPRFRSGTKDIINWDSLLKKFGRQDR